VVKPEAVAETVRCTRHARSRRTKVQQSPYNAVFFGAAKRLL